MSRVFVIERSRYDVSAAQEYGVITYLFAEHGTRASIWHESFPRQVLQALESHDFDPQQDYFLIASHLVPVIISVSVMQKRYSSIRVLFHCASENRYVP